MRRVRELRVTGLLLHALLLVGNACTLSVLDDLSSSTDSASHDGGDGDDLSDGGRDADVACQGTECSAPSCMDDIKNQGEEQTDCGGPCRACCANGEKDDAEADVDCGGSCADTPCPSDAHCTEAADCTTGVCRDARCRPGTRGAYWPASEWIAALRTPAQLPWGLVSHVYVAYAGISPDYECAFWTDRDGNDQADDVARENAQSLVDYRNEHAPGVKVLLSIGGPKLSYRFSAAAEAHNRKAFVDSCIALMNALGADGIDVDWRFPTHFAGPSVGEGGCQDEDGCQSNLDAEHFTTLLMEFRQALDDGAPTKLLSAVLRANTIDDVGNVPYDYQSLFSGSTRLLDWASVATYDMHARTASVAFGAPFEQTIEGMAFAREQVGEGHADDLALGLSFAGPAWSAVEPPDASGVGAAGESEGTISFRTADAYRAASSTCEVGAPTSGHVRNRYLYCAGEVGSLTDLWVSYDDEHVLANKAKHAALNHYAGVSWWFQGQDTAQNHLVKAIVEGMEGQNPVGDAALVFPALVQAEDYDTGGEGLAYHDTTVGNALGAYRLDDVDIEMCSDRGAGFDVGAMRAGEWLEYTVAPSIAGDYNVEFRVAATGGDGQLHLEEQDERVTQQVFVPDTGGAQQWTTVELNTPVLEAREYALRLQADAGQFSVNWLRFTAGQGPYLGAPVQLPGLIEAEYFDIGGPNVAYSDTATSMNTIERVTAVAIEPNVDGADGLHVFEIAPGEWLEYSVDVVEDGAYNLEVRAASSFRGRTLRVEVDGVNVSGSIAIPNTGELDRWLNVESTQPLPLTQGTHVIRLFAETVARYCNINWLRFTRGQVSYSGAPSPIPGTVQAESFDLGGPDVAYSDSTPGNDYEIYRQTHVDLQATADAGGGYNLAKVVAGEWTAYTVEIAETATYDIEVRAGASAGGKLHFELDGATVTSVDLAATGSSQTFQTHRLAGVSLPAGQHELRAAFESNGATYNWFKFTRSPVQ